MDQAPEIARTILQGFDKHYRIFREASASARLRFEKKQWKELRETNRARIDLYDLRVLEAVDEVTQRFPAVHGETIWPSVKRAYIALLYEHKQPECAETFFNSVAAKVLDRSYHDNQYIFRKPAVAAEHIESEQRTYRCYYPVQKGMRRTLLQIFSDFGLGVPLADSRRCVRNLLGAFRVWIPDSVKLEPNFHVQVLTSLFYRNKAAYAVGRVVNGHHRRLFVIALRHDDDRGLRVDALVHDRADLANLFSVSNAYFMVDMEVPSSWVSFIRTALPEKPRSEIYTAVGLQKQGKTLFFRDYHSQLQHSADRFVIAPGIRGMVMFVFTLPSFPYVFKIIRDKFAPPKDTSRELVIGKYRLVKHHDRVGRLADTLEYTDVAFPLERFDPGLLEEMQRMIPSSIEIRGEMLLIRHLYIEQRLTPLDMYLTEAAELKDEAKLTHGVREFGQVLRDLAAANIFPGDLLPKNFGVSPHGRVLFYDYDEVCYLTECCFREIPAARYEEDEMRAEPWYTVGPNDIFPEEFPAFLFSDPESRRLFGEIHGDLLRAGFWLQMQENLRNGIDPDLFPYPADIRFK